MSSLKYKFPTADTKKKSERKIADKKMFERLSFWRVGDKIGDISLGFMMIELISVRKKIRHTFLKRN